MRNILAEFGWAICLNDAEDLLSLVRLGQKGSIRQMAGPRGDDPSSNYSGPMRNGSYAIFEIKWGNTISRKSALYPARDTFLHKSHRTWRL